MSVSKISGKIRPFLEGLFTALLFGMQTIFNAGVFISIMALPLLSYFYLFFVDENVRHALSFEFWVFLFDNSIIVGRIVVLVGTIVFLVATAQWLWYHHNHMELFKKGLYSHLRHPQFTGIIIVTLGLTLMVATLHLNFQSPSILRQLDVGIPTLADLWFLQVIGYIIIAWFEERSLSKRFGTQYKEYKDKVPFLFPVKNPSKMPELLFTILIVIGICIVLLFLPYNFIRVSSARLIPNLPFSW